MSFALVSFRPYGEMTNLISSSLYYGDTRNMSLKEKSSYYWTKSLRVRSIRVESFETEILKYCKKLRAEYLRRIRMLRRRSQGQESIGTKKSCSHSYTDGHSNNRLHFRTLHVYKVRAKILVRLVLQCGPWSDGNYQRALHNIWVKQRLHHTYAQARKWGLRWSYISGIMNSWIISETISPNWSL